MKFLLNSEYGQIQSLARQFHYDNGDSALEAADVITNYINSAGNIQDGYCVTDAVRIGDTRYVVGKKKEARHEQFCTCHTDKVGRYTDFRFFVRWFDAMQDFLTQATTAYDQLVREHNKQHFKPVICKDCGAKLTGINGAGDIYASSHYNGTEYCDSCMIEHCIHTNCFGCKRGEYPNCEFLEQKKFYMEDD